MTNPYSVETIADEHLRIQRPKRHNPTSAKFLLYQQRCQQLFGPRPTLDLALETVDPIFHEAAVFVPISQQSSALFVTSNTLKERDGHDKTILVHKLIRQDDNQSTAWQIEEIPGCHDLMGNGGVNYPASDSVLVCAQGTLQEPSALVAMKTESPYARETLLTSFHGREFNSINDVVIAKDGAVWFTDPTYGYDQGFRSKPQLPCQVYRFDPRIQDIRVVADGFGKPNGLCFTPDEKTMYITDTDRYRGDGQTEDFRASHIYAFNVEMIHGAPFLTNRRLFAVADVGIPDGIKCDMEGNVYSGCGDGVGIWAPDGVLLGKIVIPGGIANFCFARPGELLLLNEKRLWVAQIAKHVRGALLDGMGVSVY